MPTTDPGAHPFLVQGGLEKLSMENFDERMAAESEQLVGVFFWGHDCPNCEVAKKMLFQDLEEFTSFGFKWFHVNVYEDSDLGTRFGLHGIPTFLFFFKAKRLGKISPFPGTEAFFEALRNLKALHLPC